MLGTIGIPVVGIAPDVPTVNRARTYATIQRRNNEYDFDDFVFGEEKHNTTKDALYHGMFNRIQGV